MCATVPVSTLGKMSLALQGTSAVAGAAGAYANAASARRTANVNAQLAEQQAAQAKQRSDAQSQQVVQRAAAVKSSQRAAFAGSGISLQEGSPLAALFSTDVQAGADLTTLRSNSNQEQDAYRFKAANYRAEASSSNPWLSAGTSLLGGASAVADKWYQFKKLGVLK